jgi:hypothetical protein
MAANRSEWRHVSLILKAMILKVMILKVMILKVMGSRQDSLEYPKPG